MTEAEIADDTASADAGTDVDRGPRGASFPTMDLAKAVDVIHMVGGHGADHALSTFAQYCGHQTANSGPFRTKVAAFRDWSMVTTKDGRVRLTDLGKEVALAPDPLMDRALLRRAFDACKMFKKFYDDQAKEMPLKRDTLGRIAVLNLKISPKSQDRFVSSLVDSAVTAGLASEDTEAGTVTFHAVSGAHAAAATPAHTAEGEAAPPPLAASPAAAPVPAPAAAAPAPAATASGTASAPPPASSAPVLLRQVWPTATGEVVVAVHSTAPLPASAFALVGKIVEAADALAQSIGAPESADDDDAA